MSVPEWLKPLGVAVAIHVVALVIAGELGVLYRGMPPFEGYDQSRTHGNTKNTTRFGGAGSGEIANLLPTERKVCHGTEPQVND